MLRIDQEWTVDMSETAFHGGAAQIYADDGATYPMYGPRAERITMLWNLFRDIPTEEIAKLTRSDIGNLVHGN